MGSNTVLSDDRNLEKSLPPGLTRSVFFLSIVFLIGASAGFLMILNRAGIISVGELHYKRLVALHGFNQMIVFVNLFMFYVNERIFDRFGLPSYRSHLADRMILLGWIICQSVLIFQKDSFISSRYLLLSTNWGFYLGTCFVLMGFFVLLVGQTRQIGLGRLFASNFLVYSAGMTLMILILCHGLGLISFFGLFISEFHEIGISRQMIWIGSGHLPIQALTVSVLSGFILLMKVEPTSHSRLEQVLKSALWLYFFFALISALTSFSELFSLPLSLFPYWAEGPYLAVFATGLIGASIISSLIRDQKSSAQIKFGLWGLIFLFFIMGGLTGVALLVPEWRGKMMGNFHMTGHFHPLVAGGTLISLYLLWSQEVTLKKWLSWMLICGGIVGIGLFSFAMHVLGEMGILRRDFLNLKLSLSLSLLTLGGGLTLTVGLLMVSLIMRRKK
ncbi:MAG: hypothetical protein BroJett040_15830 [Oligoflexia bacterium]|nr:MAG: hypothetical protein BroJett040_15830 [Oligoflexia bacterium]